MTKGVNFKESVELEDLAQLAVDAQRELVAAGELQVGQTAQIVAHGAVNAGAYVILEVLPQPGALGLCLVAAVQQQEDVAHGHHHGQIVHHVGVQTFLILQLIQILTVDHVLGDPQLLIHPLYHDALVHALVGTADEVAVQIQIHVVHALDIGQGLVDKNVVHIEGVLGQHHAALAQHLGAVHHRVHQDVLVRAEVAHMGPVEQAVLGEHVGVAHGQGGVVLHMLVHIVADHHVRRGAAGHQSGQAGQNLFQGIGVQPVIAVHYLIVQAGGVRDPHILRGEDGQTFYMVLTDMVSDNGWDSNRAMVLLKSTDLVNWSHSVINIQKRYPGQEKLKRVWAPQTIYNKEVGKYMVYWSMQYAGGVDVIYYAYANEDFTDLEGEPKPLFIPKDKKSCIDGDIVYKDGVYHLFYKTEGHGNGIKVATTRSLTSGEWEEQPDYKQQTKEAVEGAGTFKLIGQDKYILMYDVYMKGAYQFTETTDLKNFKVIDHAVQMNFHPRHGTIIPITRAELKRITDKWGKPAELGELPVNPVLPGFHADPEVLYSQKTQRYYIYSTTDGQPGWGGWYFTVFSSADLKDWTYEGVMLDLRSPQVPWANGNAWAPAIEEKLIDGKYKYFFYYSGNPNDDSGKKIGVAVADSPVGPFKDMGKPIITDSPVGHGQQIDVDVFTDPVSGKSYLYWGNGYMAGAELNDDMVSIKKETLKVMTPKGGTLKDYAYREAPYVFYRQGLYYFLWSVDDTGSANYHVAYGTSDSPLGPIKVAKDPVVMIQDPSKEIYGTAHNSVLRKPGTDEWYIVYHRINKNYLDKDKGPGVHREVCIDRMEFNADGTIQRVKVSK